ncbi:hypothetical protein QH494_18395 [Sphingomonas sp. AR_OL41]|uniref:hypothetical protein n=1 Tax=Sphingomonas sp. AR_OL41 TaxID=3042729 RepID=UPI0024808C46|nr:hypothetical protein [Sphingomonas sp. AR_OL41]MDH7974163.1 hypothetical protein [Sphingomonas sp. AR_OL41]
MADASATPVTAFEYLYRDASNYKSHSQVYLSGRLSGADRALIVSKLQDGEFFVAEQVGIPPLYEALYALSDGPTDDDHRWHEFSGFVDEPSLVDGPIWGTSAEFVLAFSKLTKWDSKISEVSRV